VLTSLRRRRHVGDARRRAAAAPRQRTELSRQCACDATRAARFVAQLRTHLDAYTLEGLRGDIATCLATSNELGLQVIYL